MRSAAQQRVQGALATYWPVLKLLQTPLVVQQGAVLPQEVPQEGVGLGGHLRALVQYLQKIVAYLKVRMTLTWSVVRGGPRPPAWILKCWGRPATASYRLSSDPGRRRALALLYLVSSSVQGSTVQYSGVQCSAVQCSAVQCSAVQCSAVQCSSVQCCAVQCSLVLCSAYLVCASLHHLALSWRPVMAWPIPLLTSTRSRRRKKQLSAAEAEAIARRTVLTALGGRLSEREREDDVEAIFLSFSILIILSEREAEDDVEAIFFSFSILIILVLSFFLLVLGLALFLLVLTLGCGRILTLPIFSWHWELSDRAAHPTADLLRVANICQL